MTDEELAEALVRIEGLLAKLVKLQMGPILERELGDDFARKLWRLTGTATRDDIRRELRCAPSRIAETWSRWERVGILVKDGKNYRRTV